MPNHLLLQIAGNERLKELISSSPVTRPVVERFVAGDTLDDAVRVAQELKAGGVGAIFDYLGENVSTEQQADAAMAAYIASLRGIIALRLDAHVSVKLTQLGLDLSFESALGRLRQIVEAASQGPRTKVAIDMESHAYTDRTIEAYRALRPSTDRLVLCLQAYLRRTEADAGSLVALEPSVRLCKGAYDEPKEIAFGHQATMGSYRRCLALLLPTSPWTAVATHDELCVKEAIRIARRRRVTADRFEFEMLYGVRRDLQAALVEQGYGVRVYLPFGTQWYPYLMRRMAERPANLRLFVESVLRG
ncbi:MAG TPA: proline dehydrogenase family protein [Actinomycetota bacterium]|nr:proline dehydrogenase family protein [Actinomycetota bacterium]